MGANRYLLVTPQSVRNVASVQGALALAARLDAQAAARHGPSAGADCYVVRQSADGSLAYRGLACGRRLIGARFACADGVLDRARAAIAAAEGE